MPHLPPNRKPPSKMPLMWNSKTKEPYLDVHCTSLKGVKTHIRITPPRLILDDIDTTVDILNHPLVSINMTIPLPYVAQDAINFLTMSKRETDDIIEREILTKLPNASLGTLEHEDAEARDIDSALADARNFVLSAPPIKSIREVREDGTEAYIGDVSIIRNGFRDVGDEKERERLKAENNAKSPGDPSINWSIGCKSPWERKPSPVLYRATMRLVYLYFTFLDLLHPKYHNRSIMTTVVQAMLREIWAPYLKVQHIVGAAFVDNLGSQRVLLKSGFKFTGYIQAQTDLSSRGRTEHRLAEFEWRPTEDGDKEEQTNN